MTEKFENLSDLEMFKLLASFINADVEAVSKCFLPDAPLIKNHLLKSGRRSRDFNEKLYPISLVRDHMFNPYFTHKGMLHGYLNQAPATSLNSKDFAFIKQDFDWMVNILKQYKKQPHQGCNILIYGEPGTGKTELSRAICKASKLKVLEVAFDNGSGKIIEGSDRLNKLATSRSFVETGSTAIVFDELEDAFPCMGAFGEKSKKRWFNNLLETNQVPVIWVSNEVDQLDPAFLRRFDYCVKVPLPNSGQKSKYYMNAKGSKHLLPWEYKVAMNTNVTIADIKRATSVFKRTGIACEQAQSHYFENLLKAQHKKPEQNKAKNGSKYKMETQFVEALSNTSLPLPQVTKMVERVSEGRFLLHGVPGTGKTGYVHALAEKLGKPLVCKSGSDLLGKFVGESEKAIKAMFEQATQQKAILLLDEAEAFFTDRASIQSDWRGSVINEMLVQLERFQGVFFASTNLPEQLDKAIKRRFDFSINFDYLKSEQVLQMAEQCIEAGQQLTDIQRHKLKQLTHVTPADFAVAKRQKRFMAEDFTNDNLVELITDLSQERQPKKMAIGFR